MDGLRTGRIVDFVLPEDEAPPMFVNGRHAKPDDKAVLEHVPRWRKGEHIPAIVVGLHHIKTREHLEDGHINLQGFFNLPMVGWYEDIPYSATMEPGTWHWLERA